MSTRVYTLKSGKHYRKEAGVMKCYRTGDSIKLTSYEAERLRDKLVLDVSPAPLVEVSAPKPKEPKETPKLELKALPGGKYNVVNSETGKAVNEKPMSKIDAEALIGEEVNVKE